MKNATLSYIFLMIITQSCDKKTEPPKAYIAQETKDFCVFQKGTWWEYENTRTNLLDTWKVINLTFNFFNDEKIGNVNYETFGMEITSKYNDTFKFGGFKFGYGFSTSKYFGIGQIAYFETEKVGCDNNNLELIKSYSINKICVKKEFKMLPFPCTTFFPYYTKWERHKGITEMAYYNGDTLRLKSSNIIQ
ncbi:MAG: hypothetical protein Q8K70_06980 [Bacteroidota bacterium]|nr:hypothetical protein [Bacteroidota bacterium]